MLKKNLSLCLHIPSTPVTNHCLGFTVNLASTFVIKTIRLLCRDRDIVVYCNMCLIIRDFNPVQFQEVTIKKGAVA